MTKKAFASIKSAQEVMAQIEQLAEQVAHKPTTAYATVKQIKELASKWNNDFQDVDPAWQPPKNQNQQTPANARQSAVALGAFVQA